MSTLRIVPNLRSSVLEQLPPDQTVLFTSELLDSDAALVASHPAVSPFRWSRLMALAADPHLELLEVAEPLWLGEWVRALRYIVLVALVRALRPGLGRVLVATYAIENLDARTRATFPALDAWPLLNAVASRIVVTAVGCSLLLVDAIVFGTSGAYENYRRAFGWTLRRTRHAVLTPSLGACSVCGELLAGPRDRTVLFLGAPSRRKGFAVLTEAWTRTGAADRGWRLVVVHAARPADVAVPDGVTIRTGVSRSDVHALLRTAAVVVMPSVRLRRWREQIGLPLLEGIAHGCRVVTTTETGLADDLHDHPLVTLTTPGDPRSLADGLGRATDGEQPRPGRDGGGYSKGDVVAWWLGRPSPVP